MQPGETITPGTEQAPAPEPEKQPEPISVPPAPALEPATPLLPPPEPTVNQQFTPDNVAENVAPYDAQQPGVASDSVSWTASEFIAHKKGTAWFGALGAGIVASIAIIYLVTKEIFAPVMVGIAGIIFAVFAVRPPRVLQYQVDSRGVQIGDKLFPYAELKSFSLLEEGPPAIMLLPLKKFLPPITIFYELQAEDTILDVLADYLPHEEKQPDLIDMFMSHIRF